MPGTTVNMAIRDLVGSTTYYFAVKSFDWAEPSNVSRPVQRRQRHDPPADHAGHPAQPLDRQRPRGRHPQPGQHGRHLRQGLHARRRDRAGPGGHPDHRHQRVQQLQAPRVPLGRRPATCAATSSATSTSTAIRCAAGRPRRTPSILQAMGIRVRTGSIASGAHTLYEVFWDNDWHLMDTMTTMYVFDRANPPSIACGRRSSADKTLMTSGRRRRPGLPGLPAVPGQRDLVRQRHQQLGRHRRAGQHAGRPTR